MAKFCAKCGSPIEESQKFCNKCGAQALVDGTPAVPASTPPSTKVSATPIQRAASTPSAAARVAAVPPAAAPAKKGNTALKIILAVVGFFVVIGVLAIGSCFYIVHKVKQNVTSIAERTRPADGTASVPDMHLSDGGAGSQAASAATVDVPAYPGSIPTKSGGELSAGPSGSISAQEYETPDSTEKVMAFYKDKFGSKINIVESEGKSVFNFLSASGMTTVTVARDEGSDKTKINIARIGK
jgi:zinc ribbon protein